MGGARGPRTSTVLLEAAVIDCFRPAMVLNRAEIAEKTGLSRTVVTSLVNTLVASGTLVMARGARSSNPGRPAHCYQLGTALTPVALVRLGSSGTQVTLTTGAGTIANQYTKALPGQPGWEQEVQSYLDLPPGCDQGAVRHVIVSAPFPAPPETILGRPDSERPECVAQALLCRTFPGQVLLVNAAHLAALGEAAYGAAQSTRASIHLSVRWGIGAGLVMDGRLYTGADGTAGEIAHVQVVPDGPECSCGSWGCLDTQLVHREADSALSALSGRPLTALEADELVASGDRQAVGYYRELGSLAAQALAGTVTILTPDALVIDAQLGPAHIPFAATLASGLSRLCPPGQIQSLRLLRGRLADAQASGAAAYGTASAIN